LKGHKDAPYAISDQVFWVRQGAWQLFPIELGDKKVIVKPPAEFVRVLGWLSGEGDEDRTAAPEA
jgi:hypothetical protein